jgi:Protein of unknown function DUF86
LLSDKAARSLLHIIENAHAVFAYTQGMDLAHFEEDGKTYDAVERCLRRITEAVIRLGDQAESLMPGHASPPDGNRNVHRQRRGLEELYRGRYDKRDDGVPDEHGHQNLNRNSRWRWHSTDVHG